MWCLKNLKIVIMKSSNILRVVVIIIMCYSSLLAQEEQPKQINRISTSDFYLQPNFLFQFAALGDYSEFKKLAPQSTLLKSDLSDYDQQIGFSTRATNPIFSVMLGFKFSDKQKTLYKSNPVLRLGISYLSRASLFGSLYKETRKVLAEFPNPQIGEIFYIDSLIRRSINMDYTSQQLRLDGSLIYRTNPEARWSLFAGIGITAGLSINAITTISYSKYSSLETRSSKDNTNPPPTSSFYVTNEGKTERIRNKTNLGFSAYIPTGVDFRIGKKREFWKRTHLYYEFRPGINAISIPELRTFAAGSLQHGIGIRVSWN
jgi:hypothetical protein